jgi:hypothetical protein
MNEDLNPRNPNRQDSAALARRVMGRLGLEYVEGWQREGEQAYHYFQRSRGGEALALAPYVCVVGVGLSPREEGAAPISFRALDADWTLTEDGQRLALRREGEELLSFDLAALEAGLRRHPQPQKAPAAAMAIAAEGGGWRALLLVDQIAWQDGKPGLNQFAAELFLAAPPADEAPAGAAGE